MSFWKGNKRPFKLLKLRALGRRSLGLEQIGTHAEPCKLYTPMQNLHALLVSGITIVSLSWLGARGPASR
jgi:hypothetical protein